MKPDSRGTLASQTSIPQAKVSHVWNKIRLPGAVTGDFFAFSASGKGKEVASHRTWESNFIPDVRDFGLRDRSLRGQGATGIRLHLACNTMSAHLEQYPSGTYSRGHRHGPGQQ